jgi:hypothetical protein
MDVEDVGKKRLEHGDKKRPCKDTTPKTPPTTPEWKRYKTGTSPGDATVVAMEGMVTVAPIPGADTMGIVATAVPEAEELTRKLAELQQQNDAKEASLVYIMAVNDKLTARVFELQSEVCVNIKDQLEVIEKQKVQKDAIELVCSNQLSEILCRVAGMQWSMQENMEGVMNQFCTLHGLVKKS